ncbi:MAG TPA: hypothetical protein DEA43_03690 [Candidatus Moranbacteria bacterium]|nr:hypothetical protein [Candidatus Moranbacteria bacterium]HBT45959.1 hypothetical protein [Candidatus Moranbacteria bacterium]
MLFTIRIITSQITVNIHADHPMYFSELGDYEKSNFLLREGWTHVEKEDKNLERIFGLNFSTGKKIQCFFGPYQSREEAVIALYNKHWCQTDDFNVWEMTDSAKEEGGDAIAIIEQIENVATFNNPDNLPEGTPSIYHWMATW